MVTRTQPLLDRTAADVMSREVVAVPKEMSLRAAAHMLAQSEITGAPVVDAQGRCIGVLSATDLIHWLDRGERAAKRRASSAECVCSDWQMIDVEAMPVDEVCRYMTTDLVTANPETPIGDVARRMLDAHIHRVIIVNAQGRPIGVVSTTDILAAVAYSALDCTERPMHGGCYERVEAAPN
jgi:CBS-domain-containing membrane protein